MNTRDINHFMDSLSVLEESLKKNALLYLMVIILLIVSIIFFALGASTSNFVERINGASYSLGYQIGKNLRARNTDINMATFLRGLEAGRQGQASLLIDGNGSQSNRFVMMIEMSGN